MLEFVLYACIGIAAIAANQRINEAWGSPAGLISVLCGLLLCSAATANAHYYNQRMRNRNRKDQNLAEHAGKIALHQAETAELNAIAGLNPEQLALVGRIHAQLILVAGNQSIEPSECIDLGGPELMPRMMVKEFIRDCGPVYLCPVGHYGEGSIERTVAQAVTEFMVQNRYAEPAVGRYAARWLLREAGLKAIGEG